MKRNGFLPCGGLCLFLSALAAGFPARPLSAQSVLRAQTREKLAAPVRLDMGAATLAHVVSALSAQTGLDIQAAPYLNEHQLTVQIEQASAEDVLNTLAELNGWRWYEKQDGSIVLSRPRVTTPPQTTAIPAMLQAAIPPDIQAYMGMDPRITSPWILGKAPSVQGSASPTFHSVDEHVLRLGEDLAHLLPDITNGRPVACEKLTPQQRRTLLFLLFLGQTQGFNGMMGQGLIHGAFDPFEVDVTKSEVELRNGRFMHIGSTSIQGTGIYKSGFGAPIDYAERVNRSRSHPQP